MSTTRSTTDPPPPRIKVSPEAGPPNNHAPLMLPPPPKSPGKLSTLPIQNGKLNVNVATKTEANLKSPNIAMLGSDLVPPLRSEFTLKKNIDPNDRGRPMVDWIRRPAKDSANHSAVVSSLSMVGIDSEQLQEHKTASDAWMALRGQVYDVTEYISYHPGGVKEIMKGVGKDATALFNSIHRYVNFESILKGKQIGFYVPNRRSSVSSAEGAHLITEAPSNSSSIRAGDRNSFCRSCSMLCGCGNDKVVEYEDEFIPRTKFREDKKFCFYQVDLNRVNYRQDCQDYWNASLLSNNTLLLKVITTPPDMWIGHFRLRETLLSDHIHILFSNRYRTMTVKLEKPKELSWKSIGEALPDSNLILDSRHSVEDLSPCVLVLKEEIANDMYLLGIEINHSARIGVPVGFDVKITSTTPRVSRRYTPIPLIFNSAKYYYHTDNEVLYFIVKIYPDGTMTQILRQTELHKPGCLEIGYSCGNFNSDWLHGADVYFLFAGGSGITPFIGILNFFLEHNITLGVSHVILVPWSKTKSDIVWRQEFEELEKKKKWFTFLPILTQVNPDDTKWKGLRGRISTELFVSIIELIPASKNKKNRVRFMTCGPDGFNTSVCQTIENSGYPLDSTFIFIG